MIFLPPLTPTLADTAWFPAPALITDEQLTALEEEHTNKLAGVREAWGSINIGITNRGNEGSDDTEEDDDTGLEDDDLSVSEEEEAQGFDVSDEW
mmetsp:Transcript_16068/g.31472  ORF Transcript_16068/g.31472 Transcript_16068/m.31472 type:complete len:95 (+) Transcript_16068:44-328(+)